MVRSEPYVSLQSVSPVIAQPSAPSRPTMRATSAARAAQAKEAGEISQITSKTAASSHEAMGTSVMAGCSGWPNHVPLSRLLKRRGGLRCAPTSTCTPCWSASLSRSVKGCGGADGAEVLAIESEVEVAERIMLEEVAGTLPWQPQVSHIAGSPYFYLTSFTVLRLPAKRRRKPEAQLLCNVLYHTYFRKSMILLTSLTKC